MFPKKAVIWTLALLLAAAAPVSAAPATACAMPMTAGLHRDASCCPPGACGCRVQAPADRSLVGEAAASSPVLSIVATFYGIRPAAFRAPVFAPRFAVSSQVSPPHNPLYDLYSEYRL